jgi:PPOX class probable F420-dependent enzyme
MLIDRSTPFGERVQRRLQEDLIAWLTTVGADGTPQPSPIWFLWDGETVLIYSKPGTPKLRNIARHPRVALNLDSDGSGGDIVILTGDARVIANPPPVEEVAAYIEKYRDGIAGIGMTTTSFSEAYSSAVQMTPASLRGF